MASYLQKWYNTWGQVSSSPNHLGHGQKVLLQSEGPKTVSDLVKRVGDGMYCEELRNGAWGVDTGIWGPLLLNRDALALLDAMTDRCLAVEGENDK